MVLVDLGFDDVQILIETILTLVLAANMDGHLQPPVQESCVVFYIEDAGQLYQLLPLHDVII